MGRNIYVDEGGVLSKHPPALEFNPPTPGLWDGAF